MELKFILMTLISAETENEHDIIVEKVLNRARELNIKFNKSKIQYKVKFVRYLGHKFSDQGMSVDEERVRAVLQLQETYNKKRVTTNIRNV